MFKGNVEIFNPLCVGLFHKMGPIVAFYPVNSIGREYNWTVRTVLK